MDPAAFQRIYNGGAATYKCTTSVRAPLRYRYLHTYTYTQVFNYLSFVLLSPHICLAPPPHYPTHP